jgi:drug/metabolite transporter (DMT)-like permease
MLVFTATAPLIDMFAKFAAAETGPAQIAWFRFVLQALFLAPLLAWRGGLAPPTRAEWTLHAARGTLVAAATTFFFAAVATMPLADALAIFFVAPLILTLLSGAMLGEPVGWRRVTACLVGLCGAMVVIRPGFAAFGWTAAAPLAAAVCFALYLALTRRHGARIGALAMQFWSSIAGAGAMTLALCVGGLAGVPGFGIAAFGTETAMMLLGVGVCATAAHLAITVAFSRAPAAALAPLQYLELATATLAGWLAFGDWPGQAVWIGMAMIVGSGLFVVMRERAAARRFARGAAGA